MAGTRGNIETNDGNLNVPDDAAKEPGTTIAALELTLETAGGALDTGVELSRIAAIIVGSEFPRALATADAISSESEEDVPAVTTTDAADDEGEEVQAVETKPAAKPLLVERGRTLTDSRRLRKKGASTCPGKRKKIQKTLHVEGEKTSNQHERYVTRKTAQKLEKKY